MGELGRYARLRLPTWSWVVGSAGLAGTGAIHLFLYLERGYRHIPTIGPLFLLTVVAAALLLAALGTARTLLVAVLSVGFMTSVFVGYALSATASLFGFREIGETAEVWLAALAELGGSLGLLLGCLAPSSRIRRKYANRHPCP